VDEHLGIEIGRNGNLWIRRGSQGVIVCADQFNAFAEKIAELAKEAD